MIIIKKYLFLFFICFLLLFSSVIASNNEALHGITIYIDPGHGGIDPGAVYKGIKEEDINLQIALKIRNVLENRGATAYLTRDGDYDLAESNTSLRKRSDLQNRSNLINNSNVDLYISIHMNAENSTVWSGPQVFYDEINVHNKNIAKAIQKELNFSLQGNRNCKIISDGYLYSHVKVPGVLIEAGFLSNPNERYLLQQESYQNKVANSISNGIEKYIYDI